LAGPVVLLFQDSPCAAPMDAVLGIGKLHGMDKRRQNEIKLDKWEALPVGGRRYWLDVTGHDGWSARYVKEVDTDEVTLRFWQEIRDEAGNLVEVHEKYPVDMGHRKAGEH
jgi:hypothetical protein